MTGAKFGASPPSAHRLGVDRNSRQSLSLQPSAPNVTGMAKPPPKSEARAGSQAPRSAATFFDVIAIITLAVGVLAALGLGGDDQPATAIVVALSAALSAMLIRVWAVVLRWLAVMYELAARGFQPVRPTAPRPQPVAPPPSGPLPPAQPQAPPAYPPQGYPQQQPGGWLPPAGQGGRRAA